MGIFDLFRKRREPGAPLGGPEKPRTQHYLFAHVALRELALAKPIGLIGVLHSPGGTEFLRTLWADVAEQVRAGGERADLDGSGLSYQAIRVGDYPCAMVTMPPALAPAECHYVAIVLNVRLGLGEELPENPEASYYTLERGVTMEGAERTVLCGWDAKGSHLNYGDGPPADPQAFARALADVVAGRGKLHAEFRPDTEE